MQGLRKVNSKMQANYGNVSVCLHPGVSFIALCSVTRRTISPDYLPSLLASEVLLTVRASTGSRAAYGLSAVSNDVDKFALI